MIFCIFHKLIGYEFGVETFKAMQCHYSSEFIHWTTSITRTTEPELLLPQLVNIYKV
jgi:hypothetical protein